MIRFRDAGSVEWLATKSPPSEVAWTWSREAEVLRGSAQELFEVKSVGHAKLWMGSHGEFRGVSESFSRKV